MERLLGKSSAVVPKFMSGLFRKSYKLFVDNWYKSEKLFKYLEENGSAACGTARANWLQLPKSFKNEPLRDENMLVVCFHDKKEIYFLATIDSME